MKPELAGHWKMKPQHPSRFCSLIWNQRNQLPNVDNNVPLHSNVVCIIPSLSAGKPQKHCTYQEKICKKHYKTPRRPGELLATTTVRTPSVSTTNRNKSSMQIRSDASWIKLLISQETVTNQACELQCNPGTRLRKLSVFTTTAPSALSLARPNHQTINKSWRWIRA